MTSIRFLMTILAWISFMIFFPVHPSDLIGKKIVESDIRSRQEHCKAQMHRDVESLRAVFREGVEALRKGDALMARLLLDGLEKDYPVLGDYILYERVRAALGTGDSSMALSLAGRFLNDYPESVLTSRVRMEMVKSFLSLKQSAEARFVAHDLLQQNPDPEMRRQVSLMVGGSYEGEEDWKAALDAYQELAYEAPATPEGEEAEQRMSRIMETTGIHPEMPTEALYLARIKALDQSLKFDRVIHVSDAFQKAYLKGSALEEALLLKAKALINAGRVKEGRKLYEKLAGSATEDTIQFEAAYRLGSYFWNRHENSRAKPVFRRLSRKHSQSEWGLKARYALGRIYETEGELSRAREFYLTLGKIAPRHPLAAEGAWRAGWVEYKAGRYEKAGRLFALCMQRYPGSEVFSDALYWKGRCEEERGKAGEAKKIFLRLAKDFGWDFYGIMARKHLRFRWNITAEPNDSEETGDPPWTSGAIRSTVGPVFSYHLDRAEELIRIGFFAEAEEEIHALRDVGPGTPEVYCSIADLYEKSGDFYDSVRWMSGTGGKACGLKQGAGPVFYMRYLYPLAFWETVRKESARTGLDPFLILAVMRQESLFQMDVVSKADARGLMQIIPSTAERIARELKIQDFTADALSDAEMNIAFGSWYLSSLKKRSGGDLVRLLASYNAGESQSDKWWKQYKHLDLDERIESITFRETKEYVKKVLRNLENYRRLYNHVLSHPKVKAAGTVGSQE